ncbi:MAG: SDR family oxidoreductase [Verrucomicrobiota bacterium]
MSSDNRVALVTGAGSGIGKASTLALLEDGFQVVLAGRRLDALQEVIREANLPSERAIAIPCDVTDPDSVENLFAKARNAYGRLDLLFNNAGTFGPKGLLEKISFTDWKTAVDTNLTGAFLCTQEAFKIMKDQEPQGGRIINNGSISAQVPRPNSAPYTATKHAIAGLTKSTALDGRKYNIACGQIDIGNAETDMAAPMKEGVLQANGSQAVEPLMEIENVANAIRYMASLPLDANVLNLTVMATRMPFVGRG